MTAIRKLTAGFLVSALAASLAVSPALAAGGALSGSDGSAKGNITVTAAPKGVVLRIEASGLTPGWHGVHFHEKGDCSSGDGMSTGGHFNPTAKPHGAHGAAEHHTGDLPSLKADKYGVAAFSFVSKSISVGGPTTDIVGKGLIVHRDPDDYQTQPTGNAGPRLACAVIASK